MPSAESILDSATAIANDWRWLAVAWHAAFAVAIALIAARRWTSAKAIAAALTMPLISVSALAWSVGNPFNGSVFLLLAAGLLSIALRMPSRPLRTASHIDVMIGTGIVALGWIYPHFVMVANPLEYSYAAPLGLLPCPTLLVLTGLTLATRSFEVSMWRWVVSTAALLYGVIGVAALGVTLDIGLIAAGVALAWHGGARRSSLSVEHFGTTG